MYELIETDKAFGIKWANSKITWYKTRIERRQEIINSGILLTA